MGPALDDRPVRLTRLLDLELRTQLNFKHWSAFVESRRNR